MSDVEKLWPQSSTVTVVTFHVETMFIYIRISAETFAAAKFAECRSDR